MIKINVNLKFECFHDTWLHNHSCMNSRFIVFVKTDVCGFFCHCLLNSINFISFINCKLSQRIIHWINLILKGTLQINDINLMLFLDDFHFILVWCRAYSAVFQFFLSHEFDIIDKSGIWIVLAFWLLSNTLVDGLHE